MSSVSVVIPTYNRLNSLKMVLEGLENQDYPFDQFEVVVVSDGSTDGTNEYLKTARLSFQVNAVIQENQGAASARNTGVYRAQGKYIVFIDDDTVPSPEFLREHEKAHNQHGQKTIVLGPMLAPLDYEMTPWVSWEQSRLSEQYQNMIAGRWKPTPRQFYTANASLERQYLLSIGGFDPSFRRAEDVELAYRLGNVGMRFVFNPNAIVYHYAERTFDSWIAIPYAYGINDVVFTQVKNQSWLLPMVFREYHQRHLLIKVLIRACLDRKSLSLLAQRVLKGLSLICGSANLKEVSHLACGGIFNLLYYQGIADALGGRLIFFAGVKEAKYTNSIFDPQNGDP